jgi:excisionase family DNA binding protein
MDAATKNFGNKLTSKEAARVLGVSEASVKRWADGGLLQTLKTAGGHRRFRPEDVAVFRREGLQEIGRRAARSSGRDTRRANLGVAKRKQTGKEFYEHLLAGRAHDAAALIVRLYLGGIRVAVLADEIICPAMRRVGDLWRRGELSIAQEHVASRAALEALGSLRASLHPAKVHGRLAVCCAVEEDFHELPVQLAALTLEELGWEVVNLGTSTPFFALSEAVERFTPHLICISSTILNGPDRAAREFSSLRKVAADCGASIVLGGAGFRDADARRRFAADLHADDFSALEKFAASLAGQGANQK